LLRPMHQSI